MRYRVHFVWNRRTHRRITARRLRGLVQVVEQRTSAGRHRTIWIHAPRLLLVLGLTAAIAGTAAAAGLQAWLARDRYNRIGFTDLALPWRWSHLTELRGRTYLARGVAELQSGRVADALLTIRQGLARQPDAESERLVLARFFSEHGYYPGIRQALLPQLHHGRPSAEFWKFLLWSATQADDQKTALEVCDALLPQVAADDPDRVTLLEQKAASLLRLDRPAEALAALGAIRGWTRGQLRWRIQALLAMNQVDEARAEIARWPAEGVPVVIQRLAQARIAQHASRWAELDQALQEARVQAPADPAVWIEGIQLAAQGGNAGDARQAVLDCLAQFDATPAVVTRIRTACMETGRPELVALCVDDDRQHGRPLAPPLFDLAVAELEAGNRPAASRNWAAAQREADVGTIPAPLRDLMQAMFAAVAQPADDAATPLCLELQKGPYAEPIFAMSARILSGYDHWTAVAAVAQVGLSRYPGSRHLGQWSETAATRLNAPSG